MKVKMFVSDLDGTLLNGEHKISKKTADAIRKTQMADIRWLIATGRAWATAHSLLCEADIVTDFVLLNGAEFRNASGELIYQEPINCEVTKNIVNQLIYLKVDFEINSDRGDFSTNLEVCSTARAFPDFNEFWNRVREVKKIFIFSQEPYKLNKTKNFLSRFCNITVTSSAPWNIEVTAALARKGIMVKRALEYYGISEDEVAVFGDGYNDISMFQLFRHSRAMENAVADLQELAEYVIGSNIKDGVASEVESMLRG